MKLSQDKLKHFADFIEKNIGIMYTDTNYYQLQHRLDEISTQLGHKDSEDLYQKSISGGITGMFKELLLDIATNNETSFFRDQGMYETLSKNIFPELFNGIKTAVKMWCCASSTGQEPYSISMILNDLAETNPQFQNWEMLVSDYSERVLRQTQEGVYSQIEVQRGLHARQLLKFFEQMPENKWKIKSSLKSKMKFQRINLLEEWGLLGSFDLVFCRNVLIYQDVANKSKVVEKIHQLLRPGGYLVLGAAESLLGISDRFNLVQFDRAVFYRKKE